MNRKQAGVINTTYQDILRAIGEYIDRSNLGEVRILEIEEGVILQGRRMEGEHAGERVTYQLTVEDIESLLHDAYARREKRV